ncbi:LuxR C-terminal-related transcriptional regulator [Pseudactinotalea terrae]|uniref:LuxR C-terminal-related transcriptional regulator n=1 Tax=Pseudactinotalea terrae TaxID=1743262 RepID=UPI0012E2092F|nr:LuxR C-terminal-related transcriptional regulator [Pseudactinotalea terrae]
MGVVASAGALVTGRTALGRGDWSAARASFEEAATATDSAEAWEGVGRSAWWQGDQEVTFAARERAYRSYRAAGDRQGAARVALWIASDHLDFRGDDVVAAAWLVRGRSLLQDLPPGAELGFITLLEADIALLANNDLDTAARGAREALAIARACGELDVEVVALGILGSALIRSGAVAEGLQRLDECATLAVAEEFTEQAAPGWALCHTVTGCAHAGDLARAEQWCRELHRWSTTWHARHFFGICRTAYGGVLTTRGDWQLADEELSTAMNDLQQVRPALAAPTAVRLGELRARQGRHAEARTLLESALPFPDAVIALGALDLEEGDITAAVQSAERVLRRLEVTSMLDRFPAIELLARAHGAAGEVAKARAALAQLEESGLGTPYLRARVCLVKAEVLACAGSWDDARQAAEDAVDLFTGCSAPYECARARLVLARALDGVGRGEHAEVERRAANQSLRRLGARVEEKPPADPAGGLSPREVDILRLVAQGMSDTDVAERLFLSPHTVHRHMANLRTKLGTRSRAAAVARAAKLSLI